MLNIKNKPFYFPTKIVNLRDFNPEKLEINKEGSEEIGIYCITYIVSPFYLIIDNLCGYFEENDGFKYLNLVFSDVPYTRLCRDNELKYEDLTCL